MSEVCLRMEGQTKVTEEMNDHQELMVELFDVHHKLRMVDHVLIIALRLHGSLMRDANEIRKRANPETYEGRDEQKEVTMLKDVLREPIFYSEESIKRIWTILFEESADL